MTDLRRDRLIELLADQTIFGLSEEELLELEQLKKQFPDWEKDLSLELAATAIGLSNLNVSEDLPANLRARIFASADEFFAPQENSQKVVNFVTPAEKITLSSAAENVESAAAETAPTRPFRQWLGWGLAAAACIALAVILLWSTRNRNQPETVTNPETVQTPETVKTPEIAQIPEPIKTPETANTPESVRTPETAKTPETIKTPAPVRSPKTAVTPEIVRTPEPVKTPAPVLTAAQRREQLIASAPDVIQTNWTAAKGDKRILGDVVWSNAQQKGYVRLRGMPILDASKETYQLWIVDDERDEKTPVSAGLFSVSGTGEIIIPLSAQLRIIKPKQFAISKEKAGGVVVSKPDRIVAVAKI
jgi:anti-sigma-K factor RskA